MSYDRAENMDDRTFYKDHPCPVVIDFNALSADEHRAYAAWFVAEAKPACRRLEERVTASFPEWAADLTERSLEVLGEWLVAGCEFEPFVYDHWRQRTGLTHCV